MTFLFIRKIFLMEQIYPSYYTDRESVALDRYFEQISKKDPISKKGEKELMLKIKQWDKKALDKLVNANLRFVVFVAKQYQNQWLSLQDLINEGNLWLCKAAQKFDETRKVKFISYAVWHIRTHIKEAIAKYGEPIKFSELQYLISRELLWIMWPWRKDFDDIPPGELLSKKLHDEYEREATPEYIESLLAKNKVADFMSLEDIEEDFVEMAYNDPNIEEGDTFLGDIEEGWIDMTIEEFMDRKTIQKALLDVINIWTRDKDKEVINLLFFQWYTVKEIVEQLGISTREIENIRNKAKSRWERSPKIRLLYRQLSK